MYHKLIKYKLFPLALRSVEDNIRTIIGNNLAGEKTAEILEIYQSRLISEPGFNKLQFLMDLKGYLKYLPIEAKIDRSPSASLFSYDHFNEATVRKILTLQGYSPAERHGSYGHTKRAYLSIPKNEIVRVYYSRPAEFFYLKLKGTSETNINRRLGNSLLTARSANIPGEPIDIIERVLPLDEVFEKLEDSGHDNIIKLINKTKESNPVITDFVEDDETNIGLTVRLDKFNNKQVYVVAFDLELRDLIHKSEKQLMSEMSQQCSNVTPNSIDYNQIVNYLPQLKELPTQFYP